MNVHIMFTAINQLCPIYFILSNLLFCKITHVFNPIFSYKGFHQSGNKDFYRPIFSLHQKIQSNSKTILFKLSFSCIFITETSALIHILPLISTILCIHKKIYNIFVIQIFNNFWLLLTVFFSQLRPLVV